jgi:hypothetical protein
MKRMLEELEQRTGGVVLNRAGGTVFLYRGENWSAEAAPPSVKTNAQPAAGPECNHSQKAEG